MYKCVNVFDVNIAHDRERYIKGIRRRDSNIPVFTFAEKARHVSSPAQYKATSKKEESMFKATQRGAGKKEPG